MSGDERRFERLPRGEVIKAVERKGPSRIPLVLAHWWGEGLGEQYGDRLKELERYPEDAVFVGLPKFEPNAMRLSWELPKGGAHDSRRVLDDWAKLDEFIEKLPDPAAEPCWDDIEKRAQELHEQDVYIIVGWWGLFFETPWGLRGMENLMVDYYEYPDKVQQLNSALCDLYSKSIRKGAEVVRPDGFWTSDDLGHQTQPMMRLETFDALLKPSYCRLGKTLKDLGIHWWLHSCGNNTPLMDSLIEAGVDMFHPVQKHTMDEKRVAEQYGERLGFWAGFDVQHILREGTPEEVRVEVRALIDTFDHPDGGMALAAGNGIVGGTPFENIEAFLDEACRYGEEHRGKGNSLA